MTMISRGTDRSVLKEDQMFVHSYIYLFLLKNLYGFSGEQEWDISIEDNNGTHFLLIES